MRSLTRFLRPAAYGRFLVRQSSQLPARIEDRLSWEWGRPRLHRTFPGLDAIYRQERQRFLAEILPAYEEYVTSVSDRVMAVSLEMSAFLLVLCEYLEPKRLLDLGSGFTSFLFRRWASGRPEQPIVVSVDDDPGWLGRTGSYLERQGLSTGELMLWSEFANDHDRRFDLVLHDLGSMETRGRTLSQAMACVEDHGVLVLDDADKRPFHHLALRELRSAGWQVVSARGYSRERVEGLLNRTWPPRYALVARR